MLLDRSTNDIIDWLIIFCAVYWQVAQLDVSTGQGHVHRRLRERPQETAELSQQERGTRRATSVQQQDQKTATETRCRAEYFQGTARGEVMWGGMGGMERGGGLIGLSPSSVNNHKKTKRLWKNFE